VKSKEFASDQEKSISEVKSTTLQDHWGDDHFEGMISTNASHLQVHDH